MGSRSCKLGSACEETGSTITAGIRELSGCSVYQFDSQNGDIATSAKPEVDIIFFHGLQFGDFKEAYWKTWLSRDGTVVWPKEWLGKRLPHARILSVSYNSAAQKAAGQIDVYNITENMISDLILNSSVGAGQDCPVILVGHSLGGIIIKFLLMQCHTMKHKMHANDKTKIENFITNCKGVFYYSTPHEGSRLADYAKNIPFKNEPILKLLTLFSTETARINHRFLKAAQINQGLITQAIAEGLPTVKYGLSFKVVEEASARSGTTGPFYVELTADHTAVCKAESNTDSCRIISNLVQFISERVLPGAVTVADLQLLQLPAAPVQETVARNDIGATDLDAEARFENLKGYVPPVKESVAGDDDIGAATDLDLEARFEKLKGRVPEPSGMK